MNIIVNEQMGLILLPTDSSFNDHATIAIFSINYEFSNGMITKKVFSFQYDFQQYFDSETNLIFTKTEENLIFWKMSIYLELPFKFSRVNHDTEYSDYMFLQ